MATKVVKFGGSSLADAKQIQKAAAIIKADPQRRYVVPSAPGKRFSKDIKVTDVVKIGENYTDYSRDLSASRAIRMILLCREKAFLPLNLRTRPERQIPNIPAPVNSH